MSLKAAMLLPMLGLVFLTLGILIWMVRLRYRAVLKDGLDPRYFKLYEGGKEPEYLRKVTQHFHNLLEMPVLFYIALLLVLGLNATDTVYVILSWAFLGSRLLHSYIHTTTNKLKQRKNAFVVSMAVLLILWVRIAIEVTLIT